MVQPLWKAKLWLWSSNPISEYLSKGTEIRILEEILALPCSLQHYSQVSGTLIYPTDKWIHTHTHTHTRAYTLEYSPALKKEGNPATWMNLQDIMLNEVCKSQKDKYCMNLLVTWRNGTTSWMWISLVAEPEMMTSFCSSGSIFNFQAAAWIIIPLIE